MISHQPLIRHTWLALVLMAMLVTGCAHRATTPAGGSENDSTAVADSVVPIFGAIPTIFENEMLAITQEAVDESDGGEGDEVRSLMLKKAQAAYVKAQQKATPEALKMIGAKLDYVLDEGLDYQITSDITVRCTFLPQFTSYDGEQKVVIQFAIQSETPQSKMYYVLTGKEGDIDAGIMALSPAEDSTFVMGSVKAPNVPALFTESCTQIRFVTPDTYMALKPSLEQQQAAWRKMYKDTYHL